MTAQRGMTLVEMIAALVVGVLLTLSLTTLLLSNSKAHSHRLQASIQARSALALIGQSVRNAGYFGCAAAMRPPALRSIQLTTTPGTTAPTLLLRGSRVLSDDLSPEPGAVVLHANCAGLTLTDKTEGAQQIERLQPYEHTLFLNDGQLWLQRQNGQRQQLLAGVSALRVNLLGAQGVLPATSAEAIQGVEIALEFAPGLSQSARFALRNRR